MSSQNKGILYALATITFIACQRIIASFVIQSDVYIIEILWFQSLVCTALFFLVAKKMKFDWVMIKRHKMMLTFSSLIKVIATGLLFLSFKYLLIDIASVGEALGRVLTIVGGISILGERFYASQKYGLAASIIGLGLFYSQQMHLGELNHELITGLAILLISQICAASFSVSQKYLVKYIKPCNLNFFKFSATTIILAPFVDFSSFLSIDMNTWIFLMISSLLTFYIYNFFINTYKYIDASKASTIIILAPILIIIFSHLIHRFNGDIIKIHYLNHLEYVGIVLLIIGAYYSNKKTSKLSS
ncbi:DMT family transporter [Aureibacter tunicatorum]|uniref:Drug/metabolite transporter (DMT)-like permease n=1 Tax=Aureibacter tunicatorum TaxID=866807 RepID=A0AAE3XT63_9BACT|nr:EamA family transporter [Aureibacter tunicatorum]MDR6241985.1 drug/metabolite transporter (DMT)-like permease [Aureibacter tunicatorum]BDD07282.1 putative transporter [Aureibacter tunicatorum]